VTWLSALFPARRIPPRDLGRHGERRAAWFYRLRGYRILGRNVKLRSGEIDLVVRRGRTVAIVEVKTRQNLIAGPGYDAVDPRKRERLVRLADEYALKHPSAQLRFDILSIQWTGRRFILTHFPDAFRLMSDPHRPWQWRV
jgi:putative endonuclease